jgi:hypothetical protein
MEELNNFQGDKAAWRRMTLDTGAGTTAFPNSYGAAFGKLSESNGAMYNTATGEFTEDQGTVAATGWNGKGQRCRIRGRVADIHKPLISGSSVAGTATEPQNLMFLGPGGGNIIPYNSSIGKDMRCYLSYLKNWYGTEALTDVYVHNSVYCFDMKLDKDVAAINLAPLSGGPPAATRKV